MTPDIREKAERLEAGERIVAAAIRRMAPHLDGMSEPKWMIHVIEAPARHHDILHRMDGNLLDIEQGFISSMGRFVHRDEARRMAEANGQLLPTAITSHHLFSEDVW